MITQQDQEIKIPGIWGLLFCAPCLRLFRDFSVFASAPLCAAFWIISSNLVPLLQFSLKLCTRSLPFYLSVEFLMSGIIIFISSGHIGWSLSFRLLRSVQPAQVVCFPGSKPMWLGVLQREFFLLFHFTHDESEIGSIPIFPRWARISYFALKWFHIYKRFYEQVFCNSCLRFVTISRSSGPTDGPRASNVSSTHSLTQRFLLISVLGGFRLFF